MRPHILRVDQEVEAFAPLIRAARQEGLRIGWLELQPPAPVPRSLEQAAELGVLRAVGVGKGRSVAVKPMAGQPVLKDLMRELFAGCALVLVRGEVERPLLVARGKEGDTTEDWELVGKTVKTVRWQTSQVLAALRRPRLPLTTGSGRGSGNDGTAGD